MIKHILTANEVNDEIYITSSIMLYIFKWKIVLSRKEAIMFTPVTDVFQIHIEI